MNNPAPYILLAVVLIARPAIAAWLLFAYLFLLIARCWE